MKWLYYLLEANFYLSVLYLFYRLLLQKETFYHINRWYFIAILIISFSLPLLKLQQNLPSISRSQFKFLNVTPVNNYSDATVNNFSSQFLSGTEHTSIFSDLNNWKAFLLSLYAFVTTICLIKLFIGIKKIVDLFINSTKYKEGKVNHVWLKNEHEAFSFFNWLFYHPDIKPAKAIISHEMIHITQGHSYDVLLIELIQSLNWFNPLIYFIHKDMKLNHEYLADRDACKQTINTHEYALLLINHATDRHSLALTNPIFSGEQLKKRITRLKRNESKNIKVFKYFLLLPILITLIIVSAFTIPKSYGFITVKSSYFMYRPSIALKKSFSVSKRLKKDFEPKVNVDTNLKARNLRTRRMQKSNKALVETNIAAKNQKEDSDILLNGSHQKDQVSLNKPSSDTSNSYIVQQVLNGRRVTINRTKSDTVSDYAVQPIFRNGQVSINRVRVN